MNKRLKTNDELIKELLSADEQEELQNDVKREVKNFHGGARAGAGRKKLADNVVLKFQIRVSEKEKDFIQYARTHHIDFDSIMEG